VEIIETERLTIRQLTIEDAEFILRLLNEPSFHQYIGDRGVRTVDDARDYIRNGPIASYEQHGFGLCLVIEKSSGSSIGICGLLKRDNLDYPDIGFAFVPESWSKGYAFESSEAVMKRGRDTLGINRILAITQPDNDRSIRTLQRLGMVFETMVRLYEDDIDLQLFASEAAGVG